jgi:hypothetical protein
MVTWNIPATTDDKTTRGHRLESTPPPASSEQESRTMRMPPSVLQTTGSISEGEPEL